MGLLLHLCLRWCTRWWLWGAYTAHELYQATFAPTATVGAIVAGTFVRAYNPDTGGSAGPLPRNLAPGQSLVLALSLTPPTTAGTYTFALSATADGAQLPFASLPDQILFDPAAIKWDGDSCLAPAMKAQIPPSSTDPTSVQPHEWPRFDVVPVGVQQYGGPAVEQTAVLASNLRLPWCVAALVRITIGRR